MVPIFSVIQDPTDSLSGTGVYLPVSINWAKRDRAVGAPSGVSTKKYKEHSSPDDSGDAVGSGARHVSAVHALDEVTAPHPGFSGC